MCLQRTKSYATMPLLSPHLAQCDDYIRRKKLLPCLQLGPNQQLLMPVQAFAAHLESHLLKREKVLSVTK